jgi:hypothetical protein
MEPMQGNGGGAGTVCPPGQCEEGQATRAAPGQSENGQAQTLPQGDETQSGESGLSQQDEESRPGTADQATGNRQNGTADQDRTQAGANSDQDRTRTGANTGNAEEPATTGSTRPAADINDEQRSEIRHAMHDVDVRPVAHVDFDINIGVAVPSTVVLHPLPPRIVEIVPAYSGYEFFMLADGTIIIVDPDTLQIVYVLA